MRWYKQFDIDMPITLADTCNQYTENNPPEPPYNYDFMEDSTMWIIWNNDDVSSQLNDVRELISHTAGVEVDDEVGFVVVWRYDEKFNRSPVHIDYGRDNGGKQNGSVCTAISGDLKIHLHADDADKTIIDTVHVTSNTVIALNNTKFYHSVEGHGDLIIFGVNLDTDPEEYWHD